ncbi:MAG: iron-sulfur cluster assembly scaffold protein [Candidatus Nanohaloarchaea archaeon]
MYREEILDHYKNPRNEGTLDGLKQEGVNPSCGDNTTIYLELERSEIKDVKHETDGCAISTAGISILSEELPGMKVEDVLGKDREWMLDLMGVDVSPMRVKCAMLGLKTVQKALEQTS